MPSGIYKRTEKHRKNISKGRIGIAPWNKNKTGIYSEKTLNDMKNIKIGKKHTEETKKKMRENNTQYWKGKKFTKEHRKHLSESKKEKYRNGTLKPNETCFKKGQCNGIKNPMYGRILEKSPNWQGGKSFEPYTSDFNDKFKEAIRKRDNYSCRLCGLFEDDAKKLYGKRLEIHHVDYDKKNTFPQNCCALCTRCNTITNFNRDSWKLFFQNLLKERYNYQYSQDQKIILDFTKKD